MLRRKLQNAVPKAARLVDLWQCHLRNLAVEAGVLRKNSNYARFIILARSRTGSNYLRSLLNSNRQIITFGEIFREYGSIGWDFDYVPQSRSTLSLSQKNPTLFLETRVFGNYPKNIAAVGFKIFYYHAHDHPWETVWTYLGNQADLKIIHIRRKNILKTHLSRKKAAMTNVWARQNSGEAKPNEPTLLSYEECLEDFTKTWAWEQQYDAFFNNHPKLDVFYENLAVDEGSEMRRIQEFLGVEYKALRSETVKQSNQPLSRTILNYWELKERFVGTPWEVFFED